MSNTATKPADTWSPLYFPRLRGPRAASRSRSLPCISLHWGPIPGRHRARLEDITAALATGDTR